MDLEKARNQIDAVDDQLVDLYCKRMDLCKEVALAKLQNGTPIDVPSREEAVLNRLEQRCDDDKNVYLRQLYKTVFDTSKAYQSCVVKKPSETVQKIRSAVPCQGSMPSSAVVACQGVNGAYSSVAAAKLFVDPSVTYFKSFEGVFNAVDKGLCRYGVLPIENSNTGSISQVYDLLKKYRCYIVKSVRVNVRHSLVAKRGVALGQIKTVLSHEQGFFQCEGFVKRLGVETRMVANTAVAARTVAEVDDETIAAICSPENAEIYGLQILKSDIQDNPYNCTRFICISKNLEIYKGSDKISIMLNTAHTPGSLSRILGRFGARGLNVTKLESRPIANSDFSFSFYFDFEGDVAEENVQSLLSDLENSAEQFVFLGSYKETV